jgi:hypothetical protein
MDSIRMSSEMEQTTKYKMEDHPINRSTNNQSRKMMMDNKNSGGDTSVQTFTKDDIDRMEQ